MSVPAQTGWKGEPRRAKKVKKSKWRQAKLGQVQLKRISVGFSKLNSEVVNSEEYQLYYEAAQNIRGLGVVHWKASRIWMILQKRIHADFYLQNLSTTAREGVAPPPLNIWGQRVKWLTPIPPQDRLAFVLQIISCYQADRVFAMNAGFQNKQKFEAGL